MCCDSTTHHSTKHGHIGSCGCVGPAGFGPSFWSKKKQIQMAENSLKCLREQVKDLEEFLKELKAEK
jgi:hypothetical protein